MRTKIDPLPNGVAFEFGGQYYMKQNGKLYKFATERAFRSWGLIARSIPGYDVRWDFPEHDGVLGFRAGSLLQGFADAKVYLVSNNKLMPIVDEDVWKAFGFDWSEVIVVSKKELELHDIGETLAV